jgi:hypothetical protein
LYCFTFGRVPFMGQTLLETFDSIKNQEYIVTSVQVLTNPM